MLSGTGKLIKEGSFSGIRVAGKSDFQLHWQVVGYVKIGEIPGIESLLIIIDQDVDVFSFVVAKREYTVKNADCHRVLEWCTTTY